MRKARRIMTAVLFPAAHLAIDEIDVVRAAIGWWRCRIAIRRWIGWRREARVAFVAGASNRIGARLAGGAGLVVGLVGHDNPPTRRYFRRAFARMRLI